MTELRTWHEILIADLAANRAEAINYFDLSLQEYQIDCTAIGNSDHPLKQDCDIITIY